MIFWRHVLPLHLQVSHAKFKATCDRLGGQIPVPYTPEEVARVDEEYNDTIQVK